MRAQAVSHPTDAGSRCLEAQICALVAAVASLHEVFRQLLELAGKKLSAMRAADAEALQQCATDEGGVLQILFERERQRDAAIACLAQGLQWGDAGSPRLSQIAERLPEPFSSRLRAKIAGLRQTASELQQKNRLAATVAHNLHKHIRAVFEDIASVNQESVVYGPNGKHEQRNKKSWVDAVG
jgi:hypothetical protein